MSTRVIVTGANGQLGRSLREEASSFPSIEPIFIDIEELDLTDKNSVDEYFEREKCDFVINCAAYTAVDRAESEAEAALKLNKGIVENLALNSLKHGFKIIHISTDYVFDGEGLRPYSENDHVSPQTVYGATKLEGERILQSINKDSIIIRTAWLYSLFGKNFFLIMKDKALGQEKINVVNDQQGTPTFAGDLAQAILEIIVSSKWEAGVYHFTNEGDTTWHEFACRIYSLFKKDESLVKAISSEQYKSAAKRPKYSVLDKTKIKQTFNLKIPAWEESLAKVVNSLKKNGHK